MSRTNSVLLWCGFICLFIVALWTGSAKVRSSTPLITSFAGQQRPESGRALPTVAIIFRPKDCAGLIDALRVWNAPSDENKLHVIGRIRDAGSSRELLERVVKGSGISFPVSPLDESPVRSLTKVLGHHSGSVVLIFDPQGQLRMAVPLTELSTRQARQNAIDFAQALDVTPGV